MRKDWDADKLALLNAPNPYSNKGSARMLIRGHYNFKVITGCPGACTIHIVLFN
ncbi:MAG: hypothetical protein L6245_00455 [Thermodesulfovibrionales bacterium]|nr:hypothetical protein [Thermodesulfovibrionales bacterium]